MGIGGKINRIEYRMENSAKIKKIKGSSEKSKEIIGSEKRGI